LNDSNRIDRSLRATRYSQGSGSYPPETNRYGRENSQDIANKSILEDIYKDYKFRSSRELIAEHKSDEEDTPTQKSLIQK
jgi:hypothetical protein